MLRPAVLHKDYDDLNCSIARTLEVAGERWSLLIVRDVSLGIRRFDELQESLGISRNVLSARLSRLTELGILERVRYSERPPRHEYRLTARGVDLIPVLLAMIDFGNRHAMPPGGPARVIRHRACATEIDLRHLHCPRCDELLEPGELESLPGPGASGPPGRIAAA